jgi:anti-anti-sigma factor
MYCFTTSREGVTVMQMGGDLDVRSAPELRRLLGWSLTPGARVVLDLADVGEVDTVTVGILLAAKRRAERTRARLVMATTDARIADALYQTVPPGQLEVVSTVEAAMDSLAATRPLVAA